MLKKRFAASKKENQRIKTFQAYDFSQKSEIENLFLSSLETCKREFFKNQTSRAVLKGPSGEERDKGVTGNSGVEFAINGTIKKVHLNGFGVMFKEKLIQDQAALICVFEEMFGHNQPPQFEVQQPISHQSRPRISSLLNYSSQ